MRLRFRIPELQSRLHWFQCPQADQPPLTVNPEIRPDRSKSPTQTRINRFNSWEIMGSRCSSITLTGFSISEIIIQTNVSIYYKKKTSIPPELFQKNSSKSKIVQFFGLLLYVLVSKNIYLIKQSVFAAEYLSAPWPLCLHLWPWARSICDSPCELQPFIHSKQATALHGLTYNLSSTRAHSPLKGNRLLHNLLTPQSGAPGSDG